MLPTVLLLALAGAAPAQPPGPAPRPNALSIVERSLQQDQGGWLIGYRLRYEGPAGLVVTPTEITAKVEGWLSNSRVAVHAAPRWSSAVVSGGHGMAGTSEVVSSGDESQRCRERVVVQVWTDDPSGDPQLEHIPAPPAATVNGRVGPVEPPPVLSLAPGASVHVRIRLEHLHFIFGDYDPLLGARTIEVQLGETQFRDVVPLDREQYVAQAKNTWPAPPEDRRDTHHFVSAPDSLVLEAHIPGNQYYRFPDRPVRYGQKMRLRFWYFIAGGTEGECFAHVAQYKDVPTQWKILGEGGFEQKLCTVGRWVKVEKVFRTQNEATLLALDFRVTGDVGQMWVDDVSLEPVGAASPGGP